MTPRELKIVAVTLGNAAILAMLVSGVTRLATGQSSAPLLIYFCLLAAIGAGFLWASWRARQSAQGDYPIGKRDRDLDFP